MEHTVRSGTCKQCFNYLTVLIRDEDRLKEYLEQFGGVLSGCYNVIRRKFDKNGKVQVYRCIHNSIRAYIVKPSNIKKDCPKFNLDDKGESCHTT